MIFDFYFYFYFGFANNLDENDDRRKPLSSAFIALSSASSTSISLIFWLYW